MLQSSEQKRIAEFKLLITMGQSVVFVKNNQVDENLEGLRDDLCTTKKVIYVDCKKIKNGMALAKHLYQEYQLHFFELEQELSADEYYALDYVLDLFTEIEKQEPEVVIWMDNFTEILKFDNGWIFNLLRGSFQHHQNIVHVFTSDSKKEVNQIFMNQDNSFFRFARII